MRIRVKNEEAVPLKVVLEPWATDYFVLPAEWIEFRSHAAVPIDAHFLVERHRESVVVWAEWAGALVHAYSNNGELID